MHVERASETPLPSSEPPLPPSCPLFRKKHQGGARAAERRRQRCPKAHSSCVAIAAPPSRHKWNSQKRSRRGKTPIQGAKIKKPRAAAANLTEARDSRRRVARGIEARSRTAGTHILEQQRSCNGLTPFLHGRRRRHGRSAARITENAGSFLARHAVSAVGTPSSLRRHHDKRF